jgi:hypothetical protein
VVVAAALTIFGLGIARAGDASAAPACGVLQAGAAELAEKAVVKACGLRGIDYSWGGGHASTPGPSLGTCEDGHSGCHTVGLDCSGMVRYAYYLATGTDVLGAGSTASEWANAAPVARFGASQGTSPLLPGDLMYFGGSASTIHHVAIYIGQGWIVEAPFTGAQVRMVAASIHTDYYGAMRLYRPGSPRPHRSDLAAVDSNGYWHVSADLGRNTWGIFKYGDASHGYQYVGGDFNADGREDLAAVDRNGYWHVSTNLANSTWGIFKYGDASHGYQYVGGDFNADGRDDFAAVDSNGNWHVSANLGNSTWGIFGYGDASHGYQYVSGDFNADGRDDFAAVDSNGNWHVSADLGHSTWGIFGYGDASHGYQYVAADLNGA